MTVSAYYIQKEIGDLSSTLFQTYTNRLKFGKPETDYIPHCILPLTHLVTYFKVLGSTVAHPPIDDFSTYIHTDNTFRHDP